MRHTSALRSTADLGHDMIPASAAGREDVFFFGTLMVPEVLEIVLGRPLDPDAMRPARLQGFSRWRAAGADYPVIVPHERRTVEGVLLLRPSLRDILRINHFEDEEYYAEYLSVHSTDGVTGAWVFLGLDDTLENSGEEWRPEVWAAEPARMEAFLGQARRWMDDAPA